MNGPLSSIVGLMPSFQRAGVSLDTLGSLGLSLADASRTEETTADLPRAAHVSGIELRGLTFAYQAEHDDRRFRIGPLDLTFAPGELTFITGGNGSGKSSFARLLTGLYEPEAGLVLLNGQRVIAETRDHYRQHFSAVFADAFLFDELFGLLSPNLQERVATYLDELQLTTKVTVRDGRFSTTKLSQGQRKRLALLTALIEDRPICLFDEWASDQEPAFKEIFYRRILPELKARGKTVLVITHDTQYSDVADRLLRFDDGLVVEDVRQRPQPLFSADDRNRAAARLDRDVAADPRASVVSVA
jgi:putative ATP-binding cassette transporter